MILGQVHRLVKRILESKNKLVFVSHPYSDNPDDNKIKVDKICKELFQQRKIPLSPIHMFLFMPDDRYRKIIILICKLLIIVSTECYFYDYGGLTEGQDIEYEYAEKLNKPTKVIRT